MVNLRGIKKYIISNMCLAKTKAGLEKWNITACKSNLPLP